MRLQKQDKQHRELDRNVIILARKLQDCETSREKFNMKCIHCLKYLQSKAWYVCG